MTDWVYKLIVPPELSDKVFNALREIDYDLIQEDRLIVLKEGS